MYELRNTPPWARGTMSGFQDNEVTDCDATPLFARGSTPFMDELAPAAAASRIREPRGGRRTWIGKLLVVASFAAIVATVTVEGARMWRDRRTPVPIPAAVASARDGRLELAPDRRSITRFGRGGVRWTSMQPAALDA